MNPLISAVACRGKREVDRIKQRYFDLMCRVIKKA